jgi:hypothetical protein
MKMMVMVRRIPLLTALLILAGLTSPPLASATVMPGTNGVVAKASGEYSRSTSNVKEGMSFARSLVIHAPLPSDAIAVSQLSTVLWAIPNGAGMFGAHRDYLLKVPINIGEFVRAHRPLGALISGPGSTQGPNGTTDLTYEVTMAPANRHVALEALFYTTGYATRHREELLVQAGVDWVPIQTVEMPVESPVTLTGFGTLSIPGGSMDPSRVVLTRKQALELQVEIASLSNAPSNRGCMDEETLFRINAVTTSSVPERWSATAFECEGLVVSEGSHDVYLIDTPCSFRTLVRSFFPDNVAIGTRAFLKSCGPSEG